MAVRKALGGLTCSAFRYSDTHDSAWFSIGWTHWGFNEAFSKKASSDTTRGVCPPAAWEWQVLSCKFTLFTHLLSSNSHFLWWKSCNLKGKVVSLCPTNEGVIILISEWFRGFYWKCSYTLNLKVTMVSLNTSQYLWGKWLPYPEMVTLLHFCRSGSLNSNLFCCLFSFEKTWRLQCLPQQFTSCLERASGFLHSLGLVVCISTSKLQFTSPSFNKVRLSASLDFIRNFPLPPCFLSVEWWPGCACTHKDVMCLFMTEWSCPANCFISYLDGTFSPSGHGVRHL